MFHLLGDQPSFESTLFEYGKLFQRLQPGVVHGTTDGHKAIIVLAGRGQKGVPFGGRAFRGDSFLKSCGKFLDAGGVQLFRGHGGIHIYLVHRHIGGEKFSISGPDTATACRDLYVPDHLLLGQHAE